MIKSLLQLIYVFSQYRSTYELLLYLVLKSLKITQSESLSCGLHTDRMQAFSSLLSNLFGLKFLGPSVFSENFEYSFDVFEEWLSL